MAMESAVTTPTPADERLANDPWTKQRMPVSATPQKKTAASVRPAIKSLAEGTLYLWVRRALRFRPVECTVSEDVHGVWCLLGKDLRVPLASICMVRISSVARLQFRVVRFGE